MNYRKLHVKQPGPAWNETLALRVGGSRFAHAYLLSHLESIDEVKKYKYVTAAM